MKNDMVEFGKKQTPLSSEDKSNKNNIIYMDQHFAERASGKIDFEKKRAFDKLLAAAKELDW